MKLKILQTYKAKLFIIISFITFSFSFLFYFYTTSQFKQDELRKLQEKAYLMGELSESLIAKSVYSNNKKSVSSQISHLVNANAIDYLVISTPLNNFYYQYNSQIAKENDYKNPNVEDISFNDNYIRFVKEIVYKKRKIGQVFLGYSLENIESKVNEKKFQYFIFVIILLIVGCLTSYVIAVLFSNPLKKLVNNFKILKSGKQAPKMNENRQDEIGELNSAYNNLINRFNDSKHILNSVTSKFEKKVDEKSEKLIQSEERFKGLYENITIGIYRLSIDGEIVLANPALVEMLGYNSLKELLVSGNVHKGNGNPRERMEFYKKINSTGYIRGHEQKWKKKNGETIFVRENARAVKDKMGKIQYYDGTVEDITSKKIIEDELVTAKDKAEKAVKIKTEFLAQMSHEIRTPINSIMSYSQLLKESVFHFVPEDLRFSFDMIGNGGKRLIRTVDLILNMSELQTGTYEVKIEECNIKQLLEEIVGEFKSTAFTKKLDLIFLNRLDDKDSKAEVDIYTVTQIFANLIDNAIKYTLEGSIEVVLYKNHDNQMCIDVQDTGIGISKKFRESLFDAFTQEEQGYTRKYEGNGLGMALVKEYCKLNNANITVESVKDEGTVFTITFPKVIENDDTFPQPEAIKPIKKDINTKIEIQV